MYLTHRQMQFLSWATIEATTNINVLSDYILSHHHYCMEITSKRIKTLRPLTTLLKIAPDQKITLKHALSMLYRPYELGRPPREPPTPVIIDSSQNPDNPTYINAYCYTKDTAALDVIIRNLDRAFELKFGESSILNQALLPHLVGKYRPERLLLRTWNTDNHHAPTNTNHRSQLASFLPSIPPAFK